MVSFVDNFILGIALTLPLGPITLEILRRGLKENFLEAIKTASGAFSAELTLFTLTYLGLASFSENYFVKTALGLAGVIFLIYIGYYNLKDFFKKTDKADIDKAFKIYKNSFAVGFFITIVNPLNFFMWAGIIGAFFASSTSLFVCSGVLLGIFLSLFLFSLVSKIW